MTRKLKTMDGNTACAYAAYPFTEVAAVYPITPASPMAEATERMAADGRKNLFGSTVKVTQMQSEGGAAGTLHGALSAGALATTYTASQGLLLMIPDMYKIAGELLPCVIHTAARTVASHALSIFGDHSDIYACRQTGFAMLCSNNPQEIADLGMIAHLAAIKSSVPFLHFFDGFRSSHEIQKVYTWEKEDMAELIDNEAVKRFRNRALTPEHPVMKGSAQNPDIYFQAKEAANPYYEALPKIVEEYMDKVNQRAGTNYKLFNYYGSPFATHVIVAMGSVCDTIEETIDYLNSREGTKLGLVKVRLYRPFCAGKLVDCLPDTVEQVTVLDRTKENGALGDPLWLDVSVALKGTKFHDVPVTAGRYGLGSKDVTPSDIKSVYWNASWKENYKPHFTVGINDDVTHYSLQYKFDIDTMPEDITSCKIWGLGSDGTVGANKNTIKIIGDNTDLNVQAYFSYDSKKSGGLTVSHLRFGKSQIKSEYLVGKANFVACHNEAYVKLYDMVTDLKPYGVFLLNCGWDDKGLDENLPGQVKRYIARNHIRFCTIDGAKIAEELGLGNRINTILQAAFFKLTNILPLDDAVKYMKEAVKAQYSGKGEKIVRMNLDAIDSGISQVKEVTIPEPWYNIGDTPMGMEDFTCEDKETEKFVNEILKPCFMLEGDKIPVSAFADRADGSFPLGTSQLEKRKIASNVPMWIADNCIQCNICSYVCPHAVIRPAVLNKTELENTPETAKESAKSCMGLDEYYYLMTVSTANCTGCGSCVSVCPGKGGEKALEFAPLETQNGKQEIFDYTKECDDKSEVSEKFDKSTVKGSQFNEPLLEFSGACAGCGETPYAKLTTQLFGGRMYIANATGCSSIWGCSAPSMPYTKGKNGRGPAWGNSLFEDNAEYGYGMFLAQKALRERVIANVLNLTKTTEDESLREVCENYLISIDEGEENDTATDKLISALENSEDKSEYAEMIRANTEHLRKKSMWVFGGDGWAYDIGFSGLDHVLSKGEDINVLVFDTEVYSNTGGQASKATPTGALTQFDPYGKETPKKDLAAMAMTYGNVYVAQVAMGADYNQCIKAITEAEAYHGTSLIIAYAPCINHGIKDGMSHVQEEEKKAVKSGHWHLFRFNPALKDKGGNPFKLDSKVPEGDYKDFLKGEVRFDRLEKESPKRAEKLFGQADKNAKSKYGYLIRFGKMVNYSKRH